MEIDLHRITYSVEAVLKNGQRLFLDQTAENIAWEENENELATRLNLTLRDVELEGGGRLANKLALATQVILYSTINGKREEIFRGQIWQWEAAPYNDEQVVITCYDRLYYLQKSKDNKYFNKGTMTKSIIQELLADNNIGMGRYTGSNTSHEAFAFKGKTIASMITETLEKADENIKAKKTIIRARADKAEIIKQGENSQIYGFAVGENIVSASEKYSMTELVTRVIVVGKEDKETKPPIEATLTGALEFGLLQEIHTKGDATLAEAKNAAQKILDERGKPQRSISVRAPELPSIRKGDRVHIKTDRIAGYYFVKGVSHNATTAQMQMEVEPA